MSSSDLAISVRGLSKEYEIGPRRQFATLGELVAHRLTHPLSRRAEETLWALRDVSFDVRQGEVLGVIGRNGAGKSTLFKILSRITEPTTGEAQLFGRVGCLLEVGTGFHGQLTGRENIYLSGSILGMRRKEIDRRFDEMVAFSQIERFLDTPVRHYSSGMYVRLAFAVAAHLESEILLVDEVLAVGDAEFQDKCLGKMQDVAQSGRTVVFVSHNEETVRRLCTSAMLLRDGQVSFIGAPDAAYHEYRSQRNEAGREFDDTRRLRRRSEDLTIVDAYLTLDGVRTLEIPSGCTPVLTCVVDIKHRTRFAAEVLIRSRESVPLIYAAADPARAIYSDLEPGTHTIRSELPLPDMAAGRYWLDLMVGLPNGPCLDYVEEALALDVLPGVQSGSGCRTVRYRRRGCVFIEAIPIRDSARNGSPGRPSSARQEGRGAPAADPE
jgi:ABC-type polysaccharide/polyol phosphate transport system ATPase subunit